MSTRPEANNTTKVGKQVAMIKAVLLFVRLLFSTEELVGMLLYDLDGMDLFGPGRVPGW